MSVATVDWDALLTAVWASIVAGIGATTAFGIAILGGTRAVELRRDGRPVEAAVFGTIGALGAAVVIGAITFGLVILAQ